MNDETKDIVMSEVHKHFKPEIINRMDDIVMFSPLTQKNMGAIVDRLIIDLNRRLDAQHMSLEVTDNVKNWVAESAYEPQFGARPLKRFIQKHIETPLARKLIATDTIEGLHIKADYVDDELVFEID